jgi:hypothetical protein
LGERTKMVAAITTPFEADMPPRDFGEGAHHLRGNGLAAGVLKHGLGAHGIGLRLIADSFQAVDAVLKRRVVQVGDARLDGVVEALEARFGFRRTPVQFANVLMLALGPLLSPVEHGGEDRFQPLRLEETVFEMTGDQIVQLVHRHRHTFAGCRPLPGFHRTGVVTIAPALAGANGHGAAALGAVDEAGEHGRTADDGGWRHRGMAGLE